MGHKKELGRGQDLGNVSSTEGTKGDSWRNERGRDSDSASEACGGRPPMAGTASAGAGTVDMGTRPGSHEVRVCREVRRPRRLGTHEGFGKTLDISFPSTMCLWPRLPVGLSMWNSAVPSSGSKQESSAL